MTDTPDFTVENGEWSQDEPHITAKQLAEALIASRRNGAVIDYDGVTSFVASMGGDFDLEAVAAELNKVACDKEVGE